MATLSIPPLFVQITPAGQIIGCGPVPLNGLPGFLNFGEQITVSPPQVIPLQPVANQTLTTTLNGQNCTINVYFKQIQVAPDIGIQTEPPNYTPINPCYLDLYVGTTIVIGGVICQNSNLLVRNSYLGFVGDLAFIDTQELTDPYQSGLGTRFLLTYWPDL